MLRVISIAYFTFFRFRCHSNNIFKIRFEILAKRMSKFTQEFSLCVIRCRFVICLFLLLVSLLLPPGRIQGYNFFSEAFFAFVIV